MGNPHGPLTAATLRPLPATPIGPLEHARLLAAVHTHINILPVRYGSVLPNEEAVRHFLSNRRENLLRDLVRLQGTSEIGLRIELADPLTTRCSQNEHDNFLPTTPSGQYLASRRQRYAWKDRLDRQTKLVTEDYLRAMRGLYSEWQTLTSTVPTIVRLAFLVQRDLGDAFRQRLETTIPTQTSRRCTLLGPWPPYSFV